MRILRLILSSALAITLIWFLDNSIGDIPPIGKLLDPVNGLWQNAEKEPTIPETLELEGLKAPVTVLYDDMLVPHIFAANDQDLYFTQGYVHAKFRLWQMEFQTHAAAGRLSEVVGDRALDYDRRQRRLGMVFGAERFIEKSKEDPKSWEAIQSYTRGVNAYISNLDDGDLPFEFKLLNYKPEEWTALKCGLLLKYMSNTLNMGEKDLENTNFRNLYGREMFDLLFPDIDAYADPVVERINNWNFEALTIPQPDSGTFNALLPVDETPSANPNNGSNNWAIGPSKSATGNPFLSNDMHLGLNLPSLWFYIHLNAPGVNVMGHTLPAVPSVIQGFNDSIAWGFTNAQRDLVDWYQIQFRDETMNEYLLDGEYIPTGLRVEEIKIKNQEPFLDSVRYTLFGPVMYDQSFHSEEQLKGYAFRWIAHDASEEFRTFYMLNRAQNADEYLDAIQYFSSPAQNIVFACVDGTIAHKVQGRFPLKGFEQGKFVRDGTQSSNAWQQYIPVDQNPYWINPDRGFVSSANQHPADSTYPYYITARSYESYRNRRINDVLRADSLVTLEDLKNLHFDNFSMKAAESLPMMLSYLDSVDISPDESEIKSILAEWDYYFDSNSEGASYYDTWFDNLFLAIWDEIRASQYELKYPTSFNTIFLMQNHHDLDFFDDKSTPERETVADLVVSSFRKAVEEVNDWKSREGGPPEWGPYKSTFVKHLANIEALGIYNLNVGGNSGDVVNATGRNHGPSERIIIELDPAGVKAWGHYPGGQSGNPGSPFYDHLLRGWSDGEYYEMVFMAEPDTTHSRIIYTQQISPEN